MTKSTIDIEALGPKKDTWNTRLRKRCVGRSTQKAMPLIKRKIINESRHQ